MKQYGATYQSSLGFIVKLSGSGCIIALSADMNSSAAAKAWARSLTVLILYARDMMKIMIALERRRVMVSARISSWTTCTVMV